MRQERFRTQLIPSVRRASPSRRGFTLIELLVVISVIAVLAAIFVVAAMNVMGTSREAATRATLAKISMLIDARRKGLDLHLDKYWKSTKTNATPQEKVTYRKDLERKYLPQTWDEAKLLMDESRIPTASQPTTDTTSETESAEVLYWVLMHTRVPEQQETLDDAFSGREMVIPAGTGSVFPEVSATATPVRRPYLVDGWGKPLRFYRWPTRLVRPDGCDYDYDAMLTPAYAVPKAPTSDQQTVARTLIPSLPPQIVTRPATGVPTTNKKSYDTDAADPLALFLPGAPGTPSDATQHQNWLTTVLTYEKNYHTLGTYHAPLVVSAGADNEFGMYRPNTLSPSDPSFDATKNGRLGMPVTGETTFVYDNLTNLNSAVGANR